MANPIINVSILNGSNGFRLDGEREFFLESGRSVSSAGDINGDGFDDVMVGARYWYDTFPRGYSYVVFGKASGFSAATNLSELDGNNGFLLGVSYDALVSDAGDMNGDGFDDVIIGSPGFYDYYTIPRDHPGAGYVVFGRASGFAPDIYLSSLDGSNGFRLDVGESQSVAVSSAGDFNGDGFDDVIVSANITGVVFGKASGFDATFDLSSLDGNNGFRLDGAGGSVSNAGDVNGDGFDDVIIGAGYVVFGKASGFDATFDLSSLDVSNGFRLDGASGSVSNAGDVNGDGFDDVTVSAPNAEPNGYNSGSSYVVFGRPSGFNATLDLSGLNGSNGFRLDGAAADDRSGISVSNAGDVNGDGFDDVIVGARADRHDDLIGVSYVFFGKASGFAATMDLSSLDGSSGFLLEGLGDTFGWSVSSAGDVNRDGFDDLIIGEPDKFDNGVSYVVFGGNFLNEAVYVGTPENDNLTGTTLAERFDAGDGNDRMDGRGGADVFHGDAGDDIITVADLGFQQADGGIGNDTLGLTGDGINLNLADFHDKIDGIETIDLGDSGGNTLTFKLPDLLSLSKTTDTFTVDGNGEDRITGLIDGWTDGGVDGDYRIFTNSGTTLRVHLAVHTDLPVPGVISLADLDGNNGFRIDGAGRSNQYGPSISNAGDVNGDGFDDVIIGAPFTSFSDTISGSSYVVFGKASGFASTLDLATLDGNNGFRLDGDATRDRSGESISSVGDINGDGFDDVIIGARFADPNGESSGASYVVFGKASGFDATLDLSSLNGNNGFRVDGEEGEQSGLPVSNAGDVNGDGFDDLIVSTRGGASYVVFGQASGFSATLDLSSLDGNTGFHLEGEAGDYSGYSISGAGDINGDGFDDVIVGAPGSDSSGNHSGSSYVVFGKASGFDAAMDLSSLDGNDGFRLDGVAAGDFSGASVSGAGDVNGDCFDDVIIGAFQAKPNGFLSGSSYVVFGKASGFNATLDLSSLDGSNGFRLDGAERDYSGFSVSNAGDFNGDGFDDVIVGAFDTNPIGSFSSAGSSYVVFGKASGFDAAMDLSSLDSNTGIQLDGGEAGDQSGKSVSSAGDVNGDGFDDLLVGAPYADPNGDSSSSYVVFGRSSSIEEVIQGTPGNDMLTGTSVAERFEAGDGNDTMIGRGGADVFHGGAGDDDIKVSDLSFSLVDGGIGEDVLHLDGSDLNLDLASFDDKISGIETICLYGRGDNTLTVTAEGLLNLSDTTNTLKVNGNAGDHIVGLSNGWVDGGSRGAGWYHVYTQDDAVLLVGMNIITDFA